jgi:signal transduction histidine kinase
MKRKLAVLLVAAAAWWDAQAGSQAPATVAEIERDIYDDPTSMLRDARARMAALPAQARGERLRQLSRQVMAAITLERFDDTAAVLPEAQALARELQARDLQCLLQVATLAMAGRREGAAVAAEHAALALQQARAGKDAGWCAPRLQLQTGRLRDSSAHRAEALQDLKSAVDAFEANGETLMLAVARNDVAWNYRARKDDAHAARQSIELGEAALAGFDPQHQRYLAATVYHNLAGARISAQDWDGARRDADQAAHYARAIGDQLGLAYIARLQGQIEMQAQRPALALAHYQAARQGFTGAGLEAMATWSAAMEARTLVALHRPADALRVLADVEAKRARQGMAYIDVIYFRAALDAHAAVQDAGATAAALAYADALERRDRDDNRRLIAELQERYASAQRETENRLLRGQQEVQRARMLALVALLTLAGLALSGLAMHLVRQRRLREALRELGAHNVRSLEEERKRVARELHDELGQQLAALKMEVAVLQARGKTGAVPAPQQWDELHGRIEGLFSSMRRLVTDLRPVALDAGVGAALEWLAAEFSRHTGVPSEVAVDPGCRELTPEVTIVVFRIAQEALNNVRRHAQAHRVTLALQPVGERWQLSIVDDGTGFDPEQRGKGYGLLGMQERANLVGGSLEVSSQPGEGTQVRLTIGAQPLRLGKAA